MGNSGFRCFLLISQLFLSGFLDGLVHPSTSCEVYLPPCRTALYGLHTGKLNGINLNNEPYTNWVGLLFCDSKRTYYVYLNNVLTFLSRYLMFWYDSFGWFSYLPALHLIPTCGFSSLDSWKCFDAGNGTFVSFFGHLSIKAKINGSIVVRLENEHLGNMDQYRVTREVPLPYSFDRRDHDDTDIDWSHSIIWKLGWVFGVALWLFAARRSFPFSHLIKSTHPHIISALPTEALFFPAVQASFLSIWNQDTYISYSMESWKALPPCSK